MNISKLLILILTVTGMLNQVHAQDIIIKKSGERLESEIINTDEYYVTYVLYESPDTSLHQIAINELMGIRYFDNTIQAFEHTNNPESNRVSTESALDMSYRGISDSRNNYNAGKIEENIKVLTFLITPVVMVIPVLTISAITPSIERLNYPDEELARDATYRNAYEKEARKIKTRAAWTGYGEGTVFWFVFIGKVISEKLGVSSGYRSSAVHKPRKNPGTNTQPPRNNPPPKTPKPKAATKKPPVD